jgi:hypothetical protein
MWPNPKPQKGLGATYHLKKESIWVQGWSVGQSSLGL